MSYAIAILMLLLQGILPPILQKQPSAISLVQSNGAQGNPSTGHITVQLTGVVSGHGLVAGCAVANGKTCTPSDNDTQTYTQDTTVSGTSSVIYIWHVASSASGTITLTCTNSSTFSQMQCFIGEGSKSFTLDQGCNGGNIAASAHPSSCTTSATANSSDLVFAMWAMGSNVTCTAGTNRAWTLFTNGNQTTANRDACMEFIAVTSTGTQQSDVNLSGSIGSVANVAAYK